MNMEDIVGFGPYRALGRAFYFVPGGKRKSKKYLTKAYDESLSSTFGIPLYPLNTAYYAELLISRNEVNKARKILEKTLEVAKDEKNLKALNAEAEELYGDYRWFETLHEIELCREVLQSLK